MNANEPKHGITLETIPVAVVEASYMIGTWFKERGIEEWTLGPIQSRRDHATHTPCRRPLAPGQYWAFCGETDMGQTAPALCNECGGEFILAASAASEMVVEVEGIGCFTMNVRGGRGFVSSVTVRDIISMGAGKNCEPTVAEVFIAFEEAIASDKQNSWTGANLYPMHARREKWAKVHELRTRMVNARNAATPEVPNG